MVHAHGWGCRTKTYPTKCPSCGRSVFFFQCTDNSRVFFDKLGRPWPKHNCMVTYVMPSAVRSVGRGSMTIVGHVTDVDKYLQIPGLPSGESGWTGVVIEVDLNKVRPSVRKPLREFDIRMPCYDSAGSENPQSTIPTEVFCSTERTPRRLRIGDRVLAKVKKMDVTEIGPLLVAQWIEQIRDDLIVRL